MAISRDSQRQKVYDAEASVSRGRTFASIEECQKYVDRVLARKRLADRTQHLRRPLKVVPKSGHIAEAVYATKEIRLPTGHFCELTILHEIAHHLTPKDQHGWQFCETLLVLVRQVMGVEAYQDLRSEFRTRKVRYRKPVKRTLSPEQRRAAAERLAKAREVRMASQVRGRWTLRVVYAGRECWVSTLRTMWDAPRMSLSYLKSDAQVWTTRESVERWEKKLAEAGYVVEIVEES